MLNYMMACYAVFLATGHTLRARSIKSASIKTYLHNAATFIMRFDNVDRDACKALNDSKLCPPIAQVINECKSFEEIPERREPFTLAMLHLHLEKTCHLPDDCYKVVLQDWFIAGIHGGYRQAEWCQEQGGGALGMEKPSPRHNQQALAFTRRDITFFGKNKKQLSWAQAFANPASIQQAEVRHEWQKNGDKGETKVLNRNNKKPHNFAVRAWLRIC